MRGVNKVTLIGNLGKEPDTQVLEGNVTVAKFPLATTESYKDKTGKLVTIKSVTDENDLMIINKSGITIRLKVADVRIMGRATQGVRLINLEKRNDEIGSVCKVTSETEEDIIAEEDSDASEKLRTI